ncbi:ABC transporter ATP-binding protein [Fructobacillus sp. M1-13]|uniref:ABC transporter ATP-binding protein n=1 Tax=Fructobacillus papyriferae TaxID=2713171 RepID=A0ABS5QQ24_9LACO|nr:ABC transporter ATP-binding protein [Fructobacillus papyriferae]MBS9335288.1 ABC transporter ATP-binding protein [Fructobacillus papyriferae]MCD2159043.1 ABC transporter ATP-binding protein [Fructobacillus papyriferae]
MLEVNQLQKSFHDEIVLQDISFSGQPGQVIHISGENGSGKSTIFKIIARILKADSGEIHYDSETTIGALIENPGYLEFETGLTNLSFLAKLNHNEDLEKIRRLMADFGLDPDNKRAVSKYSLGMRQKLGIIQAIMEDQNIVLLDEPTRGLDRASLNHFVELVQQLKDENKLVIIASHDFQAGMPYDKTYRLIDGVLQSEE